MKKLFSLIFAALLLVSCTTSSEKNVQLPEETEKDSRIPVFCDMSDVVIREIYGYLSTSLTHTAQISQFRDDYETFSNTTAPMIHIYDDKTYILRRFPEEAVAGGKDAVWDFECGATADRYVNTVEIYTDHNYDAEPELLPLTGHADRMLRLDNFEYLPDSGTFLTVQFNYRVDLPKILTAYTFDASGKLVDSVEFAPDHYSYDLGIPKKLLNGDLYYTYGSSLFRYDISSGEEIKAADKICGFTPQDGKMLYITVSVNDAFENVFSLMEYTPATGTTIKLGDLAFDLQKNVITTNSRFTFAYDYETSTLYFDTNSHSASVPTGIRANRLGDEKVFQVLAATEEDHRIEEIRIVDGHLILQVGNNQIEIYSIPENIISIDESMDPLRFCLSNTSDISGYRSDVFRLMEMSGYNARPAEGYLCTDPDEYAHTMAKKLLAGDTDFDIFMVTTEMSEMLKEGYYETLTNYSLLNDYYNSMIPGITNLCKVGESVVLLPIDLKLSALRVNRSLTKLPENLPETFPELTALKDSVSLSGNTRFMTGYNLYNLTKPWFNQIVSNYIIKDMDDEQVKGDLTALYKICLDLADDPAVAFGADYQNYTPVFDIVSSRGRNGMIKEEYALLPVLPMTDAYGQVVEGSFYAINPNSPNKKLAAIFLAAHLYLADKNYAEYFDKWDETVKYQPGSTDSYEIYKSQIASAVLYYDAEDLNSMLRSHLDNIAGGKITPESAADKLFRYLKMVRDE